MKKIFVMGGGGFAMEPENLLLDRYLLTLPNKPRPRVCFIGTASGDSERYIENFYKAYKTLECQPIHLSLFKPPKQSIESLLLEQDLIHVGGGNTKNLICLWREWGLDKILHKAYENGCVLSGVSAGMICWFEEGVTDSFGENLAKLDCLGLLPGSACPHFDGESNRKPTYVKFIREGHLKGGLALDDGAGTLFIDGKLDSCVSSRPHAKAFLYETKTAREQILPIRYLGN